MATKKTNITSENINEWLGSLGYLFPKNRKQLERFNTVFSNYSYELKNHKVDVNAILGKKTPSEDSSKVFVFQEFSSSEFDDLKMVARKGEELPIEIIEKIKKNQKRLNEEK